MWFSWQLVTFYLFTVGQRYIAIDYLVFVTLSIFKQFIIYIKDKFQIFHFKGNFFGHFRKAQNALMTLKQVSLLLSQDSSAIFKWNTWIAQSIKIEIDSTFTERHSIWQDNQTKTSIAFVLEQRFNVLYERNPFLCSSQSFKNNCKYHLSSGFTTQCSWEIQLSYIPIYVCIYTYIHLQWQQQESGRVNGRERREYWEGQLELGDICGTMWESSAVETACNLQE